MGQFNETMKPLLAKIAKEKKTSYLTGDFNMNLLEMEKNKEIETFFDNLTDSNFMPLITLPTRISKTSKTLIDNIYYNQFENDIISGNLTVGIADHLPQFAIIPGFSINKPSSHESTPKMIRKFKKIDTMKFNQDLNCIDWTMNETDGLDQYSSNFLNMFNQILDIHAPKILVKPPHKRAKQKQNPG